MNSLAKKTKKLAKMAGQHTLKQSAQMEVSSKEGDYRNLVTNIDIEISDKIKAKIAKKYPTDDFYSEEDTSVVERDKRTWVIDPIDGTANYVRGFPYYSSVVTVMEGGEVLASAVYGPRVDECFVLDGGQVFLNDKPIKVKQTKQLRDAYVSFHSGRKAEYWDWASQTKVSLLEHAKKSFDLSSSALDLCYLAAGRTDVVIYGTLSTLDVAGAVAMVRAAGGEVYNYETKEPVDFLPQAQRIIATATPDLLADYFSKLTPK